MKIIGKVNDNTYIAEVSHEELEKVFDKFYGKLQVLKTGENVDLAGGYDFRTDIKAACSEMVKATKHFEKSHASMLKFALMVTDISKDCDGNGMQT